MGIFLVCSKVCSEQFAFIGIDRRMHRCWPIPRNFDPKTSTKPLGLEPAKRQISLSDQRQH